MKTQIFEQLLSKEMSRKEFLLHVGFLLLAITGISGLLRTISNPNLVNNHKQASVGFGSGPYGGVKKV